jgi:hypothetical protein
VRELEPLPQNGATSMFPSALPIIKLLDDENIGIIGEWLNREG